MAEKKLRNVVPFPGVSPEALLRPGPAEAGMSALDRAEMQIDNSEYAAAEVHVNLRWLVYASI